MRGNKSFADDLIVGLGAVSSRVALLLRSAEAKPSLPRFVETKSLQFVNRSAPRARPSLENDAFELLLATVELLRVSGLSPTREGPSAEGVTQVAVILKPHGLGVNSFLVPSTAHERSDGSHGITNRLRYDS